MEVVEKEVHKGRRGSGGGLELRQERVGGKRGRVGRLRLGMQDWFLVLEGLLW